MKYTWGKIFSRYHGDRGVYFHDHRDVYFYGHGDDGHHAQSLHGDGDDDHFFHDDGRVYHDDRGARDASCGDVHHAQSLHDDHFFHDDGRVFHDDDGHACHDDDRVYHDGRGGRDASYGDDHLKFRSGVGFVHILQKQLLLGGEYLFRNFQKTFRQGLIKLDEHGKNVNIWKPRHH